MSRSMHLSKTGQLTWRPSDSLTGKSHGETADSHISAYMCTVCAHAAPITDSHSARLCPSEECVALHTAQLLPECVWSTGYVSSPSFTATFTLCWTLC